MKKLIFCFDGTCNSPKDFDDYFEDTSISNILKLHVFLGGKLTPHNGANVNTPDQQSFYYSGVGTRGNWLKRKFNALFAPPYGDMDDIIDEAMLDLQTHFSDGDEIFIFGFSRGAAIARMFAAKLEYSIKFMGIFDTVAATRGSLDLNPDSFPASGIVFEDGTVGQHVNEVLHLLSLDEKRILFQPTLFNHDKRVTEIWFAGVHSDIGGSYWFDGLSDITLKFMLERIRPYLMVLPVNDIHYDDFKIQGAQDVICLDDINIKPIVHGKLHTQVRTKTNASLLAPRVVRINVDDVKSKRLPIIHHTVVKRFNQVTDYRPYALRNTRFRVIDEDGQIGKEQQGISSLS